MNKKKQKFFLTGMIFVILIFAAVVRLYKLDRYPPQLNRDEAALAINALYIKQAAVDEWNVHSPLQFKSLGDYKLPGYIYLLAGLFQFQTNDFVVRLPAAISGIVLIIISALWLKQLFLTKQSGLFYLFFILALSTAPFAIFYSRMAWEANLALALMMSSLWLLHHRQYSFVKDITAVLIYVGAAMTYNSPFLLLPFFVLTIPLFRGVKQYKKWLLPVSLFALVFVVIFKVFDQNNTQKSDILFFKDANVLAEYPVYRNTLPTLLTPFLGSKYVYFAGIAVQHYIDTFLPNFLIIHGGQHPWHSILGQGHLYWTIYILFLVGVISQLWILQELFFAVKKKDIKKIRVLIFRLLPFFYLLISPLPSIFTIDSPHATRSLFTFLMITVFAAIGFNSLQLFLTTQKRLIQQCGIGLLFAFLIFESSRYVFQYFVVWPTQFSPDFQLGFLPVFTELTVQHPTGNVGIIDLGWYMYVIVAWYEKIPATEAIETIERSGPDTVGLYRVNHIGRYYFIYHDDDPFPDKKWLIFRDQMDGHWKLL
ncbi:MAG: hypothetical protein ABI425_00985 [Patescibacteria group bacterium]